MHPGPPAFDFPLRELEQPNISVDPCECAKGIRPHRPAFWNNKVQAVAVRPRSTDLSPERPNGTQLRGEIMQFHDAYTVKPGDNLWKIGKSKGYPNPGPIIAYPPNRPF